MSLPSSLPPLYARWIDAMLGAPIPAETKATCGDCAMLAVEGEQERAAFTFNPMTKCCTFLPEMWNFLAGAVLTDTGPDAAAARGRATLEARLDAGVAVTPLGLRYAPAYALLYRSANDFGQSRALRCPHYLHEEGGLCGVWRHRESTCATWFCKHERGAVSMEFWMHLRQLLRAVEETLAGWCLLELGLDAETLAWLYRPNQSRGAKPLNGRDIDGEPDPAELQAAWGRWLGRERELYRECARLVAPLAWADVLRIGGAPLRIYAQLTRHAYDAVASDAMPERPMATLVQIVPRGRERVWLSAYRDIDPLQVPVVVATMLPYFDGRPLSEALEEIRVHEGVRVDPTLVRKLTDFGVLRESGSATEP